MDISAIATNIIGILGGILLSLCTIPQLYTMWKQKVIILIFNSFKSADDVSMLFLVTYFVGLALSVAYLVILQAWAGAGIIS